MMILAILLLLCQVAVADDAGTFGPPLGLQDEGGAVSRPVYQLDCVGSSLACTQSGITGTLTFSGVGIGAAGTAGSVLFSDGSLIAQDNASLYFDDTNNRLGIVTTSPDSTIQVGNPEDTVRAYAQIDVESGQTASDCDAAAELGRVFLDSNDTISIDQICICRRNALNTIGWGCVTF